MLDRIITQPTRVVLTVSQAQALKRLHDSHSHPTPEEVVAT